MHECDMIAKIKLRWKMFNIEQVIGYHTSNAKRTGHNTNTHSRSCIAWCEILLERVVKREASMPDERYVIRSDTAAARYPPDLIWYTCRDNCLTSTRLLTQHHAIVWHQCEISLMLQSTQKLMSTNNYASPARDLSTQKITKRKKFLTFPIYKQ